MNFEDFISDSDNPRPRKLVIYGTHGIGKSTFAASCPFGPVVFLPTEDGYRDLRPKVKVLTFDKKPVIETEAELHHAIHLLLTNDHKFGCVVLDSAEAVESIYEKQVAIDAGKNSIADIGFGKGFEKAADKFELLLNGLGALNNAGMFVIVIAHAAVERFNDPSCDPYDKYTLRLNKRVGPKLQEWADEVLFCNYKVYTRNKDEGYGKESVKASGAGERVVYTTERPSHNAKNRLRLPDEMPFDWETYQRFMSQGE